VYLFKLNPWVCPAFLLLFISTVALKVLILDSSSGF
jgi:hypothetical protein